MISLVKIVGLYTVSLKTDELFLS